MINLLDLEKKINSELTTKINKTKIKHNQIYIEIDKDDLIDTTLFLKTNNSFEKILCGVIYLKDPLLESGCKYIFFLHIYYKN